MKKKTIGWIVLGASALWYVALRGVRAFKIAFSGLRFQSSTDTDITFCVNLQVYNPLIIDVNLKSVVADVYVNNVKCGLIDYTHNYPIRAKKTTTLTVFVTVNAKQLGETLWNGIKSGAISQINMRLDGDIYFSDDAKFPFDIYYYLSDFMQ